jgi:hypothetical protein
LKPICWALHFAGYVGSEQNREVNYGSSMRWRSCLRHWATSRKFAGYLNYALT